MELIIVAGPKLNELTELLKNSTLKPAVDHSFVSEFVATSGLLPDEQKGFLGHILISGGFVNGVEFGVLVKRASKSFDILSRLVQKNVDSFDYQFNLSVVLQGGA